MPVISTQQKVALLATYPCSFTGSASDANAHHLDTSTELETQENIVASLKKLEVVSSEIKDMLSLAMDSTVQNDWGCSNDTMNLIRPHFRFRWNWNNSTAMDVQQVERLKTLVVFSGYSIFLQTGFQLTYTGDIFKSSMSMLNKVNQKVTMAACQVRNLLLNISNFDIYTKAMDSSKPSGQGFLEGINPSTQPQHIRYLFALALEDMLETFSHLEVTDSGLRFDSDK